MSEIITVVVPTWNRPDQLEECLGGLSRQERPADRIIAVVRPSDAATRQLLVRWPAVEIVDVTEPGFIPALNAGSAAVTGGIMVFTDDDAVARPGWLRGIECHFAADPTLTGVGGRDVIGGISVAPEDRKVHVGKVRHGRWMGNHHLGAGPPRPVMAIKGVNASYRRAHLEREPFSPQLRGSGGHHNELELGVRLRSAGRRLLYDPDLVVDHYPATRADGWRDRAVDVGADEAHNEQLAFRSAATGTRLAVLGWGLIVGTPGAPGLLRMVLRPSPLDQPVRRARLNAAARLAGFGSLRPQHH